MTSLASNQILDGDTAPALKAEQNNIQFTYVRPPSGMTRTPGKEHA